MSDPLLSKPKMPSSGLTLAGTRTAGSAKAITTGLYQAASLFGGRTSFLQRIWVSLGVQPLDSNPGMKRSCVPVCIGRSLERFPCPLAQLGSQVVSFPMKNSPKLLHTPTPRFQILKCFALCEPGAQAWLSSWGWGEGC